MKNITLDLTPLENAAAEIEKEYGSLVAYEVSDDAGASLAIEAGKNINAKLKVLEEQRKAITRPIDDAKAFVMELYKKPVSRLEMVQAVLKSAILRYRQDQEKKRIEAQRAAEERARAEEAARRAELAAIAEGELAAGRTIAAAAAIHQAENVVVIPDRIEKPVMAQGTQLRSNWKHRVINPDEVPSQFKIPCEKTLAMIAKRDKDKAQVPGVEFYNEQSVAFVGAR